MPCQSLTVVDRVRCLCFCTKSYDSTKSSDKNEKITCSKVLRASLFQLLFKDDYFVQNIVCFRNVRGGSF